MDEVLDWIAVVVMTVGILLLGLVIIGTVGTVIWLMLQLLVDAIGLSQASWVIGIVAFGLLFLWASRRVGSSI